MGNVDFEKLKVSHGSFITDSIESLYRIAMAGFTSKETIELMDIMNREPKELIQTAKELSVSTHLSFIEAIEILSTPPVTCSKAVEIMAEQNRKDLTKLINMQNYKIKLEKRKELYKKKGRKR